MGPGAALLVATLGSVLPPALILVAAWAWLFRRLEPGLFWSAFGFGAAAVFAAAALQVPVLLVTIGAQGSDAPVPLGLFLVIVSLIEETLKFAGWYAAFLIFRRPMVERPGLCVGAAVTVALALATLENILFNIGITLRQGTVFWEMIAARALTSVPLHATTGLIIGLFAWRIFAERRRETREWIALIGLPFALHAVFNMLQVAGGISRHGGIAEIDARQWLSIAVAGLLVWTIAGFALSRFGRIARRARSALAARSRGRLPGRRPA